MPERQREVLAYTIDYLCDECGEPMKQTGIALMSNPPIYPHVCKNGHTKTFRDKQYPHIDFKLKEKT
jgi:hypothetical protein